MKPFPQNRTWIAPLVIAVAVALFGAWCNLRLRQTIESQLRSDLSTIIDANVTALEIWTTNQFNLATAIAEDSTIHDLAVSLLRNPEPSPAPRDSSRATPLSDELDRHLRPRLEKVGYRVAHLVDTNLSIVGVSSRARFRGRPTVLEEHVERFHQLFETGQPILITPFRPRRPQGMGRPPDGFARTNGIPRTRDNPPAGVPRGNLGNPGPPPGAESLRPEFNARFPGSDGTNRPPDWGRSPGDGPPRRRGDLTLMQVAVPIRDNEGRILGAFTLVIDPEREFTRILSVARSGASGETYALDQRGLLISRSRFDDQLRHLGLLDDQPESTSALNLRLSDPGTDHPANITPEDTANPTRPLTHLATEAVAGGSGVAGNPTRDYRGIPVVGAWRWLGQHGFGVVTQINATEAYQPLRVLNFLFLILFLLLVLCSTGMLLVSHANIAWRRRVNEAELRLRQLGQYTLQEKIGEGAMGVVYRARHGLLRRDTAVKLLLPDRADPDSIERFEREVCLSCQLSHPNTIQVFDYGRTPDGIFYYAMEYLRGLNLHDLVIRYGPVPEARLIHILSQICDSLTEAHGVGLVHRDIKPANVFLCFRGGIPDCVKVLDFGLVREFRANASSLAGPISSSAIEGTPSFLPPEAIHNQSPIDPRSDLYSVGALGYYLATGQPVFEAESVQELYEKHLSHRPVAPSRRTANPVSPELDALLLRCLEKSPENRPLSADALRQELGRLPAANSWSLSLRFQWWKDHPEASTANPTSPPLAGARATEPTLRVDLDHRTPA